MPLVNQADYARMRECTEAAVSTARKDGRIKAAEVIRNGKVLIDSDKADALWARNSKRRRGGPSPKSAAKPAEPSPRPISMPTDDQLLSLVMRLPEDAIRPIGESEERKLHYQAELAKVQALQAREEVGSIDAMKREAFALGKAVRDGVLAVVPRVSADLAALTDSFEIEQCLEAELLTALRVLADG